MWDGWPGPSALGLGPWEQGEVGIDTRKIADVKPKINCFVLCTATLLLPIRNPAIIYYKSIRELLMLIRHPGTFWLPIR